MTSQVLRAERAEAGTFQPAFCACTQGDVLRAAEVGDITRSSVFSKTPRLGIICESDAKQASGIFVVPAKLSLACSSVQTPHLTYEP